MAKKIRFPLMMKDGAAVRTLEELREHFDLESVLGYFVDGKLKTWLADRYYDEMAEKVAALTTDMPDLNARLCEILGVEYSSEADDTDFEALQRRNEKLRILREITTDSEILQKVDAVAFDQDELFDILDEAPSKIYLYGEKFSIPIAKGNITYIGIKQVIVQLEKSEYEYHQNNIRFQNIILSNESKNEQTLREAEAFLLQGNYKDAFPVLQQLANEGNPRAMFHIAMYYQAGYGTIKIDTQKRDTWLKKGNEKKEPFSMLEYAVLFPEDDKAKQEAVYINIFNRIQMLCHSGDIIAFGHLAIMYENGYGTKQDYQEAIRLYQKSADNGYAYAQYKLGQMYNNGNGVSQNHIIAFGLIEKAAKQEDALAQCKLGFMYEKGIGVPENFTIAKEWYAKSIEQGCVSAIKAMVQHYYWLCFEWVQYSFHNSLHGQDESKKPSDTSYSNCQNLHYQWLLKACEYDDIDSIYELGKLLQDGPQSQDESDDIFCFHKDINQAITYFEKAASMGNTDAMCDLGEIYFDKALQAYEDGDEFNERRNLTESESWYRKASKHGHEYAYSLLANKYKYAESYDKALEFFKRDYSLGNKDSLLSIAELYAEDIKDEAEALKWYLKAVNEQCDHALISIAEFYDDKIGNNDKAIEWYMKAIDEDKAASKNIAYYYYKRNEYDQAIKWYEYYIEQCGNNQMSFIERNLVECYKKAGKYDKAVEYLISLNDLERYYQDIGDCFKESGNKSEAVEWYNKAIALDQNDAYVKLGELYEEEGELEKAESYYNKAADLGVMIAQMHLAKLQMRNLLFQINQNGNKNRMQQARIINDDGSQNTQEKIIGIVDRYIHQIPKSGYSGYDSSEIRYEQVKVMNAKNKIGVRATGEIIGLIDTSLFGNGKDGFLFTTDGMSFDYIFEKIFVRYDEIDAVQMGKKNKSIILQGYFRGTKSPYDTTPEIDSITVDVYSFKEMLDEILSVL